MRKGGKKTINILRDKGDTEGGGVMEEQRKGQIKERNPTHRERSRG